MKRTIVPALLFGLVLTAMPSHETQAGVFRASRSGNQGSKGGAGRVEMPAESRQPRRFDHFPQMTFASGTLQRDNRAGWRLDNATLVVRADCVMLEGGLPVSVLEEGRTVIVTGVQREDGFEAYGITVQPVVDVTALANPEVRVKPSDSDPAVGEVISKPY